MFKEIYGERNEDKLPEQVFLHLVEEAGELAEALRKDTLKEIVENLPDVYAWLCSFATHSGIELEKAVWKKYPSVCPYCGKSKNCICIAHMNYLPEEKREEILEAWRSKTENMPKTLEEWLDMFKKLYGDVNQVMHFSDVGFHFMEEVGEVAMAIRNGTRKMLEYEVADVFVWLMAIAMRRDIKNLSDIFFERFPNSCWKCGKNPCKCSEDKTGPRSKIT